MRKLDDTIKRGTAICFLLGWTPKGRKAFIAFCFSLFIITTIDAQLVVTQSASANTLAQTLAGSGVVITNATRSGDNNCSGKFTNPNNNTGLTLGSGVVLSTGRVQNVAQSANNFASNSFSGSGDAQLAALTTGNIYDKSVLEFDITPQGNVLAFNYVFASEEYPEWVCTQFNDVFGFFISGPDPNGGNYSSFNLAKVPNTNLPVSINTINPGVAGAYGNPINCQSLSNSAQYINNIVPTNSYIVYDGMTVTLTAVASVVPCQTYHLKLAIADVADRIYDSGVFIEANSITSTTIDITATTQLASEGFNTAYEGCVSGKFTFKLPQPQSADVYASIEVGGTAVNGVDYPTIPSVIMIPAGQISTELVILPTEDNVVESPESIVISTVNACSGQAISSASIMIQDNIPYSVTASQNNFCQGQSAQLMATGGVAFHWSPALGLNDSSIANPVAAPAATTTYNVDMDWGTCVRSASTTLTVGGPSITIAAQPALTNCTGGPVQLSATPSAAGNYTYSWTGGGHNSLLNVNNSGSYTVTITDNGGCSGTASANVTISNLSLGTPVIHAACAGAANGSINLPVNGNSGPYNFLWSNSANTQNLSGLAAGTYTVTVSNAAGCSAIQAYNITSATSAVNATASASPVTCAGGNTGSVNLSINGGSQPYSFNWSNNAVTQNLTNVPVGNYQVTITDGSGCAAYASADVTQTTPVTITSTHSDVTCNGGTNGAINLTVSGGSNYTFNWNDGNHNQNRTGLAAGTYVVTVADATGCTGTHSVVIAQPAPISITMNTVNSGCSGASGSVTAVAANGTAPYNYSWSNSNTVHTAAITDVAPGTITVTVSDANGCSSQNNATVGVTPGNLNAAFTFSGNFCAPNATIDFVPADSSVPNSFWSFGDGGTLVVQADPPYTYAAEGIYTVTHILTDGYCADTAEQIVTVGNGPVLTPTVNHITCNNTNNGAIYLAVSGSGPYTFTWNNGATSQNRTNLVAGNYSVTVSDSHSCSSVFSTAINQTNGLNVTETHTAPTCHGLADGSINLTQDGGTAPYSFVWSNGSTAEDMNGLAAATYTVTVSDAANCSSSLTIGIAAPAAITIAETHTDATCYDAADGSIHITANGGAGQYSYSWSNNATVPALQNLTAGGYSVIVKDANNCSTTANVIIGQPAAIEPNLTAVNPRCAGQSNGSISLNVTGGNGNLTYHWQDGPAAESRTGLTAGNYSVTITDAAGCSTIASATLSASSQIVLTETHADPTCADVNSGAIQVAATGGNPSYDYTWSNGRTAHALNGLGAGTYNLTVTDAQGCQAVMNNITLQAPVPVSIAAHVTDIACSNANTGRVAVTVNSGTAPYQYIWSNGAVTENIANVAGGNYTVTVTDSKACNASTTAFVGTSAALNINAEVKNLACNGQTGAINITVANGTAPYQYSWSNGSNSEDLQAITSGTYAVSIEDANHCAFDTVFEVVNANVFNVTATGGGSIKIGETIELHAVSTGSAEVTYSWSPVSTMSCTTCADVTAQPEKSVIYTVVATDSNGCTARDTVSVEVVDDNNIFIPNAFTPNGDGNNDYLQIYGNLASIKKLQMLVFDRWGEKVFETDDANFQWDGFYKGQKLEPAVYLYVLKVVHLDGTTNRTFKGTITLLK